MTGNRMVPLTGRSRVPLDEFLEARINRSDDGHWYWIGQIKPGDGGTGGGYGVFMHWSLTPRTTKLAHRIVYERWVGPIPAGYQIDHLCRVRLCVNPAHLEAVTQAENIRRQPNVIAQVAKTHCPQGHPYSGENLRLRSDGSRGCRSCDRASAARGNARKRHDPRDWPSVEELADEAADQGAADDMMGRSA